MLRSLAAATGRLGRVVGRPASVVRVAQFRGRNLRSFASAPLHAGSRDSGQAPGVVEGNKTHVVVTAKEKLGALEEVLRVIWKHDVNMTRIESKPAVFDSSRTSFHIDFDGTRHDDNIVRCLAELETMCDSTETVKPTKVPWFPTLRTDIDNFSQKTLDAGAELESDHPGFSDEEYRQRRNMIVSMATSYKFGQPLPRVEYTDAEKATWKVAYNKLKDYTEKYAVDEYNEVMGLLEKDIGFTADDIPQLGDISDFLKRRTGFTLRPVGGLLSARDFLNGLAFKVFFSTQYIRHHTQPLYTPEPDIIHELLGHAPMFANPDFARFSHEIGLASLGASDEEIRRLGTCYWFSVEFGICQQHGAMKAYGAGLLSSFGELEYSCKPLDERSPEDDVPEYLPWEPEVAAEQDYPITCYQPTYFVADSLADACERMRGFCESLNRPFNVRFDEDTSSVWVDRAVERGEYRVTMQKD